MQESLGIYLFYYVPPLKGTKVTPVNGSISELYGSPYPLKTVLGSKSALFQLEGFPFVWRTVFVGDPSS